MGGDGDTDRGIGRCDGDCEDVQRQWREEVTVDPYGGGGCWAHGGAHWCAGGRSAAGPQGVAGPPGLDCGPTVSSLRHLDSCGSLRHLGSCASLRHADDCAQRGMPGDCRPGSLRHLPDCQAPGAYLGSLRHIPDCQPPGYHGSLRQLDSPFHPTCPVHSPFRFRCANGGPEYYGLHQVLIF